MVVTDTANPNTAKAVYCGGLPLALVAEAHGNGYTSLGAFSFSFVKTVDIPGPMHGCATLTAPNGDTLAAIYDVTAGPRNSNGFAPATGTLTFTGGTGKFRNASGKAEFTVVFLGLYPGASFPGGPPRHPKFSITRSNRAPDRIFAGGIELQASRLPCFEQPLWHMALGSLFGVGHPSLQNLNAPQQSRLHLLCSLAARSNSATRASMSSSSIAFAE
jgi:hypothetical protein